MIGIITSIMSLILVCLKLLVNLSADLSLELV